MEDWKIKKSSIYLKMVWRNYLSTTTSISDAFRDWKNVSEWLTGLRGQTRSQYSETNLLNKKNTGGGEWTHTLIDVIWYTRRNELPRFPEEKRTVPSNNNRCNDLNSIDPMANNTSFFLSLSFFFLHVHVLQASHYTILCQYLLLQSSLMEMSIKAINFQSSVCSVSE